MVEDILALRRHYGKVGVANLGHRAMSTRTEPPETQLLLVELVLHADDLGVDLACAQADRVLKMCR